MAPDCLDEVVRTVSNRVSRTSLLRGTSGSHYSSGSPPAEYFDWLMGPFALRLAFDEWVQ